MTATNLPPLMESPPGPKTVIDGKTYLYFGGTSYLGLAGNAEVIEAACDAARRFGMHSATSRTGFGHNAATVAVERLAAEFFGKEKAFYYVSGYVGNHILIQAVAERFDVILMEEMAHFCLQEASALPGKPIVRFAHRDAEDFARKVRECAAAGKRPLALTDGIFPATGEIAPLDRYVRALADCGAATLLIDDAHGFGAVGENGRGSLEHFGLWDGKNSPPVNGDVLPDGLAIYVSGTLSKALGGFGGILAGSADLIERAHTTSHYYNGASAPASPVAGGTAKALEIVLRDPGLRKRLQNNVALLRGKLRELGLAIDDSPASIVGVTVGDAENMRRIHRELKAADIIVPYSTYSGAGKEGTLRIAVFANHTLEMLERLVNEFRRIL
ncbi:MAG: pyridoxal phosphate-dependent aminotransferase family protein [Pirellulales bacterium]|nr:pyridoxal phosphate-dependent aminotransferase family protein [Pirellulales bacterium]